MDDPPPERRLGRNIVASILSAGAQIGVALISIPLILDGVGLSGFGVWTLAQALVLFVGTADAGVGPAVQRFTAVAEGAGDTPSVARLLWTTCLLYTCFGVAIALLALLAGPALASLFNIPAALESDAGTLFRLIGAVTMLALVGAGLGNVLQGLERFVAVAVTSFAGSAVFLVSIPLLLASGAGLPGLAVAALLQHGTICAGRAIALLDVMVSGRPALIDRAERKSIIAFSLRLQVNFFATLVNSQTDKLVVGAISSAATLGEFGIASQVTDAGRLVAGAALAPMGSRLAQTAGAARDTLGRLHAAMLRNWTLTCLGGAAIGAASLGPLIEAWLGDGHTDAGRFAAILVGGYGIQLLTGPSTAYLRAVGNLGPEVRLGLLVVGANVVLSIAGGLLFGAYGVVAATAVAYIIGTTWFFVSTRHVLPGPGPLASLEPRFVLLAVLASAGAFWAGDALAGALPSGLALIPVAAVSGAAFLLYLVGVFGRRIDLAAPPPRTGNSSARS